MKKLLFLFAVLLGTVGAWAEGLSDGVYIIENVINKRGTICAADGINNVALTGITYSGYENNSQTSVENGEKWYVFTLFGKTYLYNLGNNKFVADKSGDYAVYSDNVPSAGMQIEKNGEYYVFKSNSFNLSCCLGYNEMVRWLSTTEAASQHFTVTRVENGENVFSESIATAIAKAKQITSTANLENTKAYYLRSKRGALLYNSANPTQLSSTVAYGNISNTSTAAEWAIIKNNDKYYFYSLEGKKFIGQNTNEGGRYPMQVLPQNDVQIVSSTVSDYPFLFSTDNYGAINHFSHTGAPGVANWKGNNAEGGLRSTGDAGSVHQIMVVRDLTDEEIQDINNAFNALESFTPKTGVEYVLYDATHKVFLDINNLTQESDQQQDYNKLASLNSEKQSLYITAENYSWKIHTTADGGSYLGQYPDNRPWNTKVSEDQSGFSWAVSFVKNNDSYNVLLENTSGKNNGFLGNEGHANGSPLFVNQTEEAKKLKFQLHEASLVYKVVLNVTSGAIVYNGKNYANGEYIFAQEVITAEDLTVKRVPGKEATFELNEETKTITVTYAHGVNFTAGDKIFIRNKQNANDYLYVDFSGGKLDNSAAPSTKKINHLTKNGSNIDHKFCWELKATTHGEEQCFYLYNPYYDWYAGSLIATTSNALLSKTVADAGKYKIETEGDYFVIHCLTSNITGGTNRNFVHWYSWWGGGVVGWERDSDASQWQVEEVTEEMEELWQNTLASQYSTLTQHEIGTGVNQYSGMPENLVEGFNALSLPEEATAIEKARYCVYALYDYASAVEALVINQPSAGFYRIKSQNSNYSDRRGKYLQNTSVVDAEGNPQGLELSNAAGINSIMYIDESKTILSYASGRYLNNYSVQAEIGTEASSWTILENARLIGKYAFLCSGGSNHNGYLSDWLPNNYVTNGQNDGSAAWEIEAVTELPFTFKKAALGFATFNAPVPVELPEGVLAYVAEVDENKTTLHMYRLEGNVIPANTPVMLYNEAAKATEAEESTPIGLKIVDVYTGGEADAIKTKNDFYGTVAAETYPASTTGETVYSLQKKQKVQDTDPDMVGFYKKADNTTLGGFKAWVKTATASARAFTIIFDGDDATGLKEALGLENENVEIYDLSGRRLDKPAKGVNVIGGKLVIK